MIKTIATERLILRQWKTDNLPEAEALYKYASDPEIGTRTGWQAHTSVTDSMNNIKKYLAVDGTFAITLKGSDDPIGSISLKEVSQSIKDTVCADKVLSAQYNPLLRSAKEFGYWIGKPYWGQGLVPEALSTLINYGFEILQLDAIWGKHNDDNYQSARVMQKCGLHAISRGRSIYLPLIDQWHDTTVQVLERTTWQKNLAPNLKA